MASHAGQKLGGQNSWRSLHWVCPAYAYQAGGNKTSLANGTFKGNWKSSCGRPGTALYNGRIRCYQDCSLLISTVLQPSTLRSRFGSSACPKQTEQAEVRVHIRRLLWRAGLVFRDLDDPSIDRILQEAVKTSPVSKSAAQLDSSWFDRWRFVRFRLHAFLSAEFRPYQQGS